MWAAWRWQRREMKWEVGIQWDGTNYTSFENQFNIAVFQYSLASLEFGAGKWRMRNSILTDTTMGRPMRRECTIRYLLCFKMLPVSVWNITKIELDIYEIRTQQNWFAHADDQNRIHFGWFVLFLANWYWLRNTVNCIEKWRWIWPPLIQAIRDPLNASKY